ncbi:GPI ethanolamine phosphate transferase 1-like [Centruroides sculpturatus]|uniref:GPI ethanolamine phosphate transferase 1-like n=1 Tax=Centruroides sculpturatus TaxID=218467 RepID=UPI000C6CCAF8|nr:GPI ethanolamine phosphate transferase 1-like [Centruroides sculpturatus]
MSFFFPRSISVMWVTTLGIVIHIIFLSSVFDIYFKSPIIHGLSPHYIPLPPPAKRVVLFVADGLRADKLLELNEKEESRAPYLRNILSSKGAWGISHTRVPTESRPGHVAIAAGFYEDVSAVFKGWKENPVEFDSVFNESRYTWAWGSPDILPMFAKGNSKYIYIITLVLNICIFYFSVSLFLAFIGWINYVILLIIKNHTAIIHISLEQQQSVLLAGEYPKLKITLLFLFIGSIVTWLLYEQNSPAMYYIYFLTPVFLWNLIFCRWDLIQQAQIYMERRNYTLKFIGIIIICIVGLELLVASFFRRGLLSLGLIFISLWPLTTSLRYTHKFIAGLWFMTCIIMAIFPFLPVVGRQSNYTLVTFTGWIYALLAAYCARSMSEKQTKKRKVADENRHFQEKWKFDYFFTFNKDKAGYAFRHFGNKEWMCDFGFLIDMTQHLNDLNVELQGKGQFIHNLYDKIQGYERKLKLWKQHLLQNNVSHFPHLEKENVIILFISIYIMKSTSDSIENKTGLPLLNQMLSWLILGLSFILPIWGSTSILTRLLNVAISFLSLYLLMSITYDALFCLGLCVTMFLWLYIEHLLSGKHYRLQDVSFEVPAINFQTESLFYRMGIDDIRRSYFFIFFIILAFFGTGNIASINRPINFHCYLFLFYLYIIYFNKLFQILIPFLIVSCVFRAILVSVKVPPKALLMVILVMTDFMGLHFFFLVQDSGSWLDIGISISHYVIMMSTTIFVMILYGVAWLLTSCSFAFSIPLLKRHLQ